MRSIVKSISYDQTEIINNILQLHVPSKQIDCDPTYSKGNFYKNSGIPPPKYKFDIEPIVESVEYGDSRHLPLPNESINCLMFDPPFLATTGKSLTSDDDNNKINKRFGVYPSESELHQFYVDSMREIYRVLKNRGVLIFKCQDKVSGGKQYFSHCFIKEEAEKIGFYPKDLFILLAKNRIMADWQVENQKNARKFHSYFWVFEKGGKTVQYVTNYSYTR
jgi:SAM-dependent methyltransferase